MITKVDLSSNNIIAQIPQCTSPDFICYKMVHYGIIV